MLVTELIRRGAVDHRDRIALLAGDEQMTFGEADALSNRLARLLGERMGLAGRRVGLLLANDLLAVPIDFAAAKARVARVPLNARLSVPEHAAMLKGAGVTHLIASPALSAQAHALKEQVAGLHVHGVADLLREAQGVSDARLAIRPEPEDILLILYTSGTTGVLKAAQHSHASFAAIAANILLNLIDPKPGDIMLHAASLIHASGTFVLPYWIRGGASAVLPGFDPAAYVDAVERYRPTALNMVPTMLGMLMALPGIEQRDFSSVERVIYGASPMPRPLMRRALELWGPRFTQYYGQTEAPLCITVLPPEDHADPEAGRLASCGKPSVDCEIRLIDSDGNEVPEGEPGEIAVRAPFACVGYLDAPELNEATFLPGGWVRTRDVGCFDDDGYLYLIERTSDMIVTGGYNVYPREVEEALLTHPGVAEAAVVGLPDEKWVEAVTAFVVLRADAGAEEAELIAHVRESLAGYKVPKSVRFIDAIPKSAVGKPLRRVLREPYWQDREPRR